MIRVKVYATLRPIVGSAIAPIATTAGSTVQTLVDEMVSRWSDLRPEMVNGDGQLLQRIHIFINGKDIVFLNGVGTVIPEGANVDIFPPVGGG